MKFFWRYIFPMLFGLVVYGTIRLVTDTMAGDKFWYWPWQKWATEVSVVILSAFAIDRILHYLIRRFQRRQTGFSLKKIFAEFGELLVVCFALINPILYFVHYLIKQPVKLTDFVIANVVFTLYILLYYAIARGNNFIKAYVEQQLQLEKAKTDHLQTELKFLKAQYHPHFLFNALNTVYFQMDENVAEAKKSIEKFSELLRYQLYDQHQTVPVSQEIQYLQNFIDLQKMRSSEKLELQVDIDKNLNGQLVYPLLFLPLVENAFKYVGGDYHLTIEVRQVMNNIHLTVVNSVPETTTSKVVTGIGLENLKRRLDLLYPEKHQLLTITGQHIFRAELTIELI